MKVIVVASQKGGAGKTTLVGCLAVAAQAGGMGPVVMLDTDPQATLTRWWNARAASSPDLASSPIGGLAKRVRELAAAGFNLCVIDTPPAITDQIAAVIRVADMVVLPVRPSPADLWAIGATVDLCKAASRPFVFVVTQATKRSRLTQQALDALAVHGPVAPTPIHSRVAFPVSLATGQTAHEIDAKGPASAEVDTLLGFVRKSMEPMTRKAVA